MIARRAMGLAAAAIVLTACAADSSPSATPSVPALSQLPTPIPTPSLAATAAPSPTPIPTPNQADIPRFAAGAIVAPRVTIRLRDLPGTQWGVAANLQPGARVQVVLGPILTGGFGWYLVRDVDPAAPSFREGWVAAGFAPNAFLGVQPSATAPPNSPTFAASYAGVTDGHFGPFHLEGSTALRWAIAVPTGMPSGAACAFTGILSTGGQSVTFLKTAAGQTPAPGTVQPSFFATHPTLSGDLFLRVASDCSWAVSVVRLPL